MVACSSLELVLAVAVAVVVAAPVAPARPAHGAFTAPPPPTLNATAGNRTQWMLDLTYHGAQLTAVWPPLSEAEHAAMQEKEAGWFALATRSGDGGHLQWGQTMPQVQYTDATRSAAARYDDVGDINAWTGQLLSALVHKYAVDRDAPTLRAAGEILRGFNFSVHGCFADNYVYVPRCWAVPEDGAVPWKAWRAYFAAPTEQLNDTAGVHNCTAPGSEHILWQGDASRDTYIGVLSGLAASVLALDPQSLAAEHKRDRTGDLAAETKLHALAVDLFETIYDRLARDKFWIIPPPTCSHPGGRPDAHCPLVNPTASMQATFMRVALSVNPEKYEATTRHKYAELVRLAIAEEAITPMHSSGYYGNNLMSQLWYIITRFEARESTTSPVFAKLKAKMLKLLEAYAPHLQPNLPAYMVAALNLSRTESLYARIVEAALWDSLPAPNLWRSVDHHNDSATSYAGADVKCGESDGCSTTALLVHDRPPNEFLWQIDPTKLEGGGSEAPETSFGGAFLLPYHVLRTAGLF
eukprot:COSAG06_NODE_8146_length_2258_cov_3.695229_2_plen_524_part_00